MNLLQTLPFHENMFLDFESNMQFFNLNFGVKSRHTVSSKPQTTMQFFPVGSIDIKKNWFPAK